MPSQLTLFDLETPPLAPLKYRLFVGIFPSPEAVESISTLQGVSRDQFGLRGKFRPREILHTTLHHIDDYPELPERVIEKTIKACSTAFEGQPPIDVTYDHVKSFRQGPFVLVNPDGNQLLKGLHHRLVTELAKQKLAGRSDFKFEPHITLLYDRQIVPEQSVARISWTVNEAVLVLSYLGETKYEWLHTWTLGR